MKRWIAGLLVTLMVFSLAACGAPAQERDVLENWGTYQLGHIAVRVPSDDIWEETEEEYGVEIITAESSVPGTTVKTMRFVGFTNFLLDLGIPIGVVETESLHGALHGFVGDFLAEEGGGEVLGESEGEVDGIFFYSVYGETVLHDANFEIRAFVFEDDFYAVMILWDDDNAEFVEPFFESIRFS